MSAPLQSGKQPIKLGPNGVRVSKIRRDPPPIAKKIVVPDRDEMDQRAVVIGVLAFTLAILVAIVGISTYGGWSPRQVTLEVDDSGTY